MVVVWIGEYEHRVYIGNSQRSAEEEWLLGFIKIDEGNFSNERRTAGAQADLRIPKHQDPNISVTVTYWIGNAGVDRIVEGLGVRLPNVQAHSEWTMWVPQCLEAQVVVLIIGSDEWRGTLRSPQNHSIHNLVQLAGFLTEYEYRIEIDKRVYFKADLTLKNQHFS